MKRLSCLFVLAGAVTTVACSGSAPDATEDSSAGAVVNAVAAPGARKDRVVNATSDATLQTLSSLFAVTQPQTSDQTTVRVYELGGGDPAMNGDYVWVAVQSGDTQSVWNTHLNVSSVSRVAAAEPGVLRLSVAWDTLNAEGAQAQENGTVTLRYSLVDGGLSPSLSVDAPESLGGRQVAHDEPSAEAKLLGSVYGLHKATTPSATARIIELAGADPAMNGDHLVLSVQAFPEQQLFDLGSDFATVKSLTKSGDQAVTLTGTSDTMGNEGQIRNAPFTAKIAFSVDAHSGKIAPSVKVTR